jgi:hypothetical protein
VTVADSGNNKATISVTVTTVSVPIE